MRQVVVRTGALATGLTALVFLLQVLRISGALPQGSLGLSTLLGTFVGTAPAILGLTAPMAFLIAIAITLGDAAEAGELQGWFAIGGSARVLLRPIMGATLGLTVLTVVTVGWLGPLALQRVDDQIHQQWDSMGLVAPTQLSAQDWIALERIAVEEGGQLTLQSPRWLHTRPDGLQFLAAEHGVVQSDGSAVMEDVQLVRLASETWVTLGADHVVIRLPVALDRMQSPVPTVEQTTVTHLWNQGDNPVARGQIVKRLALGIMPLALVMLLLATVVRFPQLATTSHAVLLGLGLAVSLHLLARGSELMARTTPAGGLSLLLVVFAVTLATGARSLSSR